VTADLTDALGPLAAAWTAMVGAVVGSFLNVVIARVPTGESIVHPGSRCPCCRAPIRWYDNLPLVSWIALRARCRSCGARISPRYPLVEALGAAAALVAFARHGFSGAAAAEFAFAAGLLALAFIDLDTWLLPNVITWPLMGFGIAMGAFAVTPASSIPRAASGAGLGFAAFALVAWIGERVFKKEALGFGDVWLLACLGAWMGPAALLPVVLLASIQGAVVGLSLIALGKGEPGPPLPLTAGPTESPSLTATPTEPLSAPRAREIQPATTPPSDSFTPPALPAVEDSQARTSLAEALNVNDPGADWIPPKHAVPFGPFLVAGALEWLWLGGLLARAVPMLDLFR
jgi:leader peptidase (prepilin peptidase)/N-methyltransferase